ncbi:MAG: flagellar biosynthesis protein FlhB [Spirochaetaceae bacterium]
MRFDELLFRAQLEAMHLQWFAAEDEGRTEEPTEHKIRKAREDGKVAKSQDVTQAIVLLFTAATLALVAGFMFREMGRMVSFYFSNLTEIDVTETGRIAGTFLRFFVRLTLPIGAVAFVAAVMGNVLQVGLLFTVKPITPDFKKIAPNIPRFVQKSFMSTEALFNLAKALGKVLIVGVIAFVNIRSRIDQIANLLWVPFLQSVRFIALTGLSIVLQVSVVFLVLSIFDYYFQRRQHRESLKMTRQEVKEERKTYEGDPLVKSRLRQRMQEVLSRNMVRKVPEADVVVTNPTHFAVAMEYKRELMTAPMVTAKGQDLVAQRIREIAVESGVPIIENRPLARALYHEVDIGDEIPQQFYEAAVAVLKQVYTMKGQVG